MKEKKVAILQSNYIPWKGYFDMINMVDEFIFYDDVQYTKNDWRNRNQIKTVNGKDWLTVPCGSDLNRLICEVEIKDHRWQKKHFNSLQTWYGKSPCFKDALDFLKDLYFNKDWTSLSELNHYAIKRISNEFLNLEGKFGDSRAYTISGNSTERLIDLLQQTGATHYLSGKAAEAYLDLDLFGQVNIEVEWMDYSGYAEYPQLYGDFIHDVSILDLIFNVGDDARNYLKSVT